ncbi:MAG: PspC domain-containing protein [Acidobacteriota bacterium]
MSEDARPTRALTRSHDQRLIAGVCGGIAEWLGWDPTIVRVLYVLLSVCSAGFPGILVYLVLWMVMPEPPPSPNASADPP